MKIVVKHTADLKDKIIPCVKSLHRHYDNYQVITFSPKKLATYCNDFPNNRSSYYTAQGGEFIEWVTGDDDVICLLDADTIMQRTMTEEEKWLMTPKEGEFLACYCSYPPATLDKAQRWLLCEKQIEVDKSYVEFCAAFLIATKRTWMALRDIYVHEFFELKKIMKHHAMTQWLINRIVQKHFTLKIMPDNIHNAEWYKGTMAILNEKQLFINDELVVFNHFKFQDKYYE